MARKTWTEKLAVSSLSEVKVAPKDFADIKKGQRMLLVSAQDVAKGVSDIGHGESVDMKGLRAKLSEAHGAEIACPVVTGIHFRTVAEVAAEQLESGIDSGDVVPVWRAMPPKAPIWTKLDAGKAHFKRLRRAEGLQVQAD